MRRIFQFLSSRLALVVVVVALLNVPALAQKTVHVKGYTKKDGTVVKPYDRAAPGSKTPSASSPAPVASPPPAPAPPSTAAAAPPAAAPAPNAERPEVTRPAPVQVVSAADDPRATVTTVAPIYLIADASRTPLRTAAVNTKLRVLENQGEWIKVEFQDPQYGIRQGFVQAKNVSIPGAELQPMDLSVPAALPAMGRPVASTPAAPIVSRAALAAPVAQPATETVYVTRTGAKYHRAGCRSLAKSAIPMSLAEAARVYAPCSICRPPTR